MCVCWDRKTSRDSTGDSQKLNKVCALFGREKKIATGVCNFSKLATVCISISPTTVGSRVKQKIHAALIVR